MRFLSGFRCRTCGAVLSVELSKGIKQLIRVRCDRCGKWTSIIDGKTIPTVKELMK